MVVVVVGGAVGPVYGVSGLLSGPDGQWSLPHRHGPEGGLSARSIFS